MTATDDHRADGRPENQGGTGAPMAAGAAVEPAGALGELESLKADKAFLARVHGGDPAALAHWQQAHQAAFPEPDQEAPAAPGAFNPDAVEVYVATPISSFDFAMAIRQPAVREAAAAIGMAPELLEAIAPTIADRPPGAYTREGCVDSLQRSCGGDQARLSTMIEDIDRALDSIFDASPEMEKAFRHPALIFNPKVLERLASYGKVLAGRPAK